MKNILLLVHEDDGQEARLQVALDVARAVGGHLECLEVREFPVMAFGGYAGGAEALAIAEIERLQREFRIRLERRLEEEDVPWSFGQSFKRPADALADGADLADLIVLSARLEEGDDTRTRPETLPLRTGRPLLAVPPAARSLRLDRSALIAWDGSSAANEAVRGAVPLLRCAASVSVMEIDPPGGRMPMQAIATYLSRHGIVPNLIEKRRQETIASTLLDQISGANPGFLVMGAYGDPPIAEAIFGGVTRTMLAISPIPLLMAH
ncbi:MAG: universal stress protein [Porphyrobacter sp.]|nr:universal stress protein [Porphyrobacter sp.]